MSDTNVKMRSIMITDKNGYTIHAKIEDTGSETGKVDAYDEIIFDKDADLSKFNRDELREQIGTRLSNYKEYSTQTKFNESDDSLPDRFENGVRYNVGLFTSAKPAPALAATAAATQSSSSATAQTAKTTQATQASATASTTTSTSFPLGNIDLNSFAMFNDPYNNYCRGVIQKDTPGLSLGSYIGTMSGNMGLFDFSFMTAMCDLLKGLFCFGNTTTTTTSSNTDTQKAAVATSTATATTASATTEAKTTPKASDDIASVNIIEEEKEPVDGNGAASAPTPPKHKPHSGNRLHKKVTATTPKPGKGSCEATGSSESQKLDDKWKTLTNIASHINEPGQSVSEQQSRIAYYTKDHPDVFGSDVLTKESYESTDSPAVRANKVRINNLIDKMNSVLDPSTKIDGKDYKKSWVQSEIQRVNAEIEKLSQEYDYNVKQRDSKVKYNSESNSEYKKFDYWVAYGYQEMSKRREYVAKLKKQIGE